MRTAAVPALLASSSSSLSLMMLPHRTEVFNLCLFSSVMQSKSLAPISIRAEFGLIL